MRFCPDLKLPEFSPKNLFESACFKEHQAELSLPCKSMMTEYVLGEGKAKPIETLVEPGTGGSTGSNQGQAVGTPLYEACKADQLRACPALRDPWTEADLFEAACFKVEIHSITPQCKVFYEKFLLARHYILGIFVSGSLMLLASGILSVLTLCCCFACCVRLCVMRKRQCRTRCLMKMQTAADSVELTPTNKSVNYDALKQEEEAQQLPQPQFVFPTDQQPIQVFTPYTGPYPEFIPPGATVYVAAPAESQQL